MRKQFLSFGLAACLATAGHACAQDKEPGQGETKVIRVHRQEGDKAKGAKSAVSVEMKDGKLVIVDSDGNRQEIDVSDAKGVQIMQSEVAEAKDGEVERKVTGKAIIIGPDGKQTEMILGGDAGPGNQMKMLFKPGGGRLMKGVPLMQGLPLQGEWQDLHGADGITLNSTMSMGKYYLGIQCEQAGKTLQQQLGLDEGTGLVAVEISPDSPAEKAGIEAHDVLLFADETRLSDTSDLSKVVNQAGEDSKAMTLTILRGGKENRIELTPAERPAADAMFEVQGLDLHGLDAGGMKELMGEVGERVAEGVDAEKLREKLVGRLGELQRLGPGLIMAEGLQGAHAGELKATHEELRRAADEMRVEMKKMHEEMARSHKELEAHLKELHAMRDQMFKDKAKSGKDKSDKSNDEDDDL